MKIALSLFAAVTMTFAFTTTASAGPSWKVTCPNGQSVKKLPGNKFYCQKVGNTKCGKGHKVVHKSGPGKKGKDICKKKGKNNTHLVECPNKGGWKYRMDFQGNKDKCVAQLPPSYKRYN